MTLGSAVSSYVGIVGAGYLVFGIMAYVLYRQNMKRRHARKDLTRLSLDWAMAIDAASIAAIASTATHRITGQDIRDEFHGQPRISEEVLARIILIRKVCRDEGMTDESIRQLVSRHLTDLRNLDDVILQEALHDGPEKSTRAELVSA